MSLPNKLAGVFVSALLISPTFASATVVTFETDFTAWNAATGTTHLIDFESFSGVVTGNEFSSNPGSPIFTLQSSPLSNPEMFSGDDQPEFDTISGRNVLYPRTGGTSASPTGIGEIRITFSTPVLALGAFFTDVESAFAVTGFDLGGDDSLDVVFSSAPGDNQERFLGFTTDTAVSVVDIHFGNSSDGTAIDDLQYELSASNNDSEVPEPGALAVFGIGLAGFHFLRRRQAPVKDNAAVPVGTA